MPDTTELLAGLREALNLWDDTGKAYEFLRKRRADIEAAVRDAEKWKGVESVMAMAADKIDGQITASCGLLLIDDAARKNAGKVELRFNGVTNAKTGELGDWTIRIEKAAMAAQHNSAREEA